MRCVNCGGDAPARHLLCSDCVRRLADRYARRALAKGPRPGLALTALPNGEWQLTAAVESPCCGSPATSVHYIDDPFTGPFCLAGVACPGCGETFAVELFGPA